MELSDLPEKYQRQVMNQLKQAIKVNKFHNEKVKDDGYTFDSKAEAVRYAELKLLQKEGIISNLKMQVSYTLVEGYTDFETKQRIKPMIYKADFTYRCNGKLVVEDVKGMRTQAYINKKKIMRDKYGIEIQEIKR